MKPTVELENSSRLLFFLLKIHQKANLICHEGNYGNEMRTRERCEEEVEWRKKLSNNFAFVLILARNIRKTNKKIVEKE